MIQKTNPMRFGVQNYYREVLLIILLSALVSGYGSGCAIPISYYDATTYHNLTSLKAEAATLVETFDYKPVADNESAIQTLLLSFRKAYEHEKGKGRPDKDTVQQFTKLRKLLDDDIADYRSGGPGKFGPKYFREAAVVLEQAFDIVIATENLKNKDKN